ncbi:MAG: class I SAM-dependent methyltransferase [Planctomycetota bacterium]|jgi:cyclopropane fatty-acyl-phospholipid synthase-like methyltransferase
MSVEMLDQVKADAFAEKLMGTLNSAGLALMTSIGHRTRLFDRMAELPPATSQEVAEKAGLNERYVREWLGTMVTSGVVEYDPGTQHYRLPAEHAAFLTRAASPDNIATTMQFIPVLAKVEDRIVECFGNGGGVPYTEFPRFHQVMQEESNQSVLAGLLEHILPLVPDLVDRLEQGIDVLDVGCGSGRAMNLLARTFPNSRFTGYDFSEEGIANARDEAREHGCTNARFEVRDVSRLEEPAAFDLITAFDAIHDQASPDKVLAEVCVALRPGGTFLMQDIRGSSHVHNNVDHPIGTFLYAISCMHCMTVSLADGGAGLGTMWGEELALEMLREAGFTNVDVKQLPHDFQNSYYVATRG